jgi:hypothetical protein
MMAQSNKFHCMKRIFLILLIVTSCLYSCSTTRPCSKGGDLFWYPEIKKEHQGTKSCKQQEFEGVILNHGEYKEYYRTGKLAIQGQFYKGKKEGLWTMFNENGDKVIERLYVNGTETPFGYKEKLLEEKLKRPQ